MKKNLSLICFIFLAITVQGQSGKSQTYPEYCLKNTELCPFHSKVTGRDYMLYIGYPDSYFTHSERKYPVIYATDGYWNFVLLFTLGPGFWYQHEVPEYIVVGIGYADKNADVGKERMYELSPNYQDYGWAAGMNCKMGGSKLFLNAIKKEIIPYVQTNMHVDTTFRVLAGKSMGGLFSLYAMYEEPGLFNGIIAVSPVVDWDHLWLFHRASELRAKAVGNDGKGDYYLHTRQYMAVGGAEDHPFIGGIKAMNEIIKDSGYKDFDYKFRIIEGEDHGSDGAEAFNRGIRFVFQDQQK